MKRLVILIVIVLLLASGGGAAWWFLLREAPTEATAAAEGEPAPEAKGAVRKRYIELGPMILPIIREGQVTLHLTVVLAVELVTPMPEVEVAGVQRPLRDAMLSELHAVYALRYIQEKGFDHPLVRERLTRASERILGPGSVKDILVRNVGARPPVTG